MSKQEWQRHRDEVLEAAGLANGQEGAAKVISLHVEAGCGACVARRKTIKANGRRKAKHEALTGLGLVRVRGALGGTYYE